MNTIFLTYFIYLLVSIVGFYLLGFLILSFTKLLPTGKYTSAFSCLLLGITSFIVAVSLIKTSFRTINLGFVLLAPILYFQLRETKGIFAFPVLDFSAMKKQLILLLELAIAAFFIFSIRYWRSYGLHPAPEMHDDFIFYAKLSYYLLKFGVETNNLEYIYKQFATVLPYHYYEEWLNGGLYWVFNASPLVLIDLVTYALGLLTIWAGLCAIAEHYLTLTNGIKLICFLGVFITGIDFPKIRNHIFEYVFRLNFNVFFYPKLFPIYLFLIAAILFYLNRKIIASYIMILWLAIISIVAAPAAFFTTISAVFYLVLKKKNSEARTIALLFLIVAIFLFVFYGGSSFGKGSVYKSSITNLNSSIYSTDKILRAFKLFSRTWIQLILNYLWVIILTLSFTGFKFVRAKINLEGIIYALFFITGSLVTWVGLLDMVDSWQFFINSAIPLVNILVFLVILNCLKIAKQNFRFVYSLLILVTINFINTAILMTIPSQHNKTYLDKVFASVKNVKPIGAYIRATPDYYNIYIKSSANFTLGGYLLYEPANAGYHTVNLSVFDIPKDCDDKVQEFEQHQIENTSFFQFVKKQKQQGNFRNVEQSQLDFVEKFKLDYIFVSRAGSLPKTLIPKVKKVIVDPLSGEKFYLLRNNGKIN